MNSIKNEIAKNLLFYRKRQHMTQRELADKVGVKHNAVSSWENGTNSIDVEVLFRICEALEISLNDIYGAYSHDQIPISAPAGWRDLDEADQQRVEDFITALLSAEKYSAVDKKGESGNLA